MAAVSVNKQDTEGVADSRARTHARDRIARLCASSLDERTLRAELLTEVRRVVGFDAYVWLLTDPVTTVGTAPLAEVPCLPALPAAIRLKYLTEVNRWTTLVGFQTPVRLLHQATQGEPDRSLIWRELLRHYGIIDVASVAFPDRHGLWGFLDLWRDQQSGRFTDEDAALLSVLAGPVTAALRQCQARTFVQPTTVRRDDRGPAVLLLDDGLQILSQTTAATRWLSSLLPTSSGSPIPAAAYNVAAQLLAREAGVDQHPASARTHLTGQTWLVLRASRLPAVQTTGPIAIAVSIEEADTAQRLDLFARSHGLSSRERHLLRLLSQGLDTRDLAHAMVISEYTVQDHLKSIFTKTSLNSRNALITAALGGREDSSRLRDEVHRR